MSCPGNSREPAATDKGPLATARTTTDLVALFECPICYGYLLPPILQCHNGHLICRDCRSRLSRCPICRCDLAWIRNLAMEKLAESLLFPCKHAPDGCGERLPPLQKTGHEQLCEFQLSSCPWPGARCGWQGPLDSIVAHLRCSHGPLVDAEHENVQFLAQDIHGPQAAHWVVMQACFGRHFLLTLVKRRCPGHQQFFARVQLIGTVEEAQGFACRLELKSPGRRMSWETMTQSICDPVSPVHPNSDCMVINTDTACLFAENGQLRIFVSISRP